MKLNDCIEMALGDLKKRKFRTFLTAFGIAVGTMLIIVMFGLGQGLEKIAMSKFSENDNMRLMTVLPKVNKDTKAIDKKIDRATIEKIKNVSGVSNVLPSIESSVTGISLDGKAAKKTSVKGVDFNYNIFTDADKNTVKGVKTKNKQNKNSDEPIIAGKNVEKGEKNKFLIGQSLLNKMGIKDYNSVIGKEIELKVEIPQVEGMPEMEPLVIKGTAAGVINSNYKDGKSIIIPVEAVAKVQEYYTGESDYLNKYGYSSLEVEGKSFEAVKTVGEDIKKLGFNVESKASYTETIKTQFNVLKGIFTAGGVIVLLVSAIGVINTMSMAVFEKTKSIGIMKAQGASRGNITTMFTVQSGVLGFIGGAMGTVFALIMSVVVNNFMVKSMKAKGIEDISNMVSAPIWVMLAAIGFAVVVSIIAGLVPARKAAKLDPVESLRYE